MKIDDAWLAGLDFYRLIKQENSSQMVWFIIARKNVKEC